MWFKMFDWLRLFARTAIYPILLREVLFDIYPFIVMMLIILGLFGNGLYIFNYRALFKGEEELYPDLLPDRMMSAMMTELLIMVGEPDGSKYLMKDEYFLTVILWVWFLLAILMTNIVFMNVLIAIISDTFDRVWEHRQTYILSSQADILCDWLNVIKREPIENIELFMYTVTPTHTIMAESWDGKIASIKKLIDLKFT